MPKNAADRNTIAPVFPPDALTLGSRVKSGEADPQTLLREAEARADRLDPQIGAICRRTPEEARRMVRDLDGFRRQADELGLGFPFAGVPFLLKDLGTSMKGVPTVAGSRWGQRHAPPAAEDGDLLLAFAAMGLIPFGKTTVPEFGLSLATAPAVGPVCRNPWDLERIPGGSSGGAAAAVAAGIVPIAHATDAGGSIRVPAACCGVLGMKPSRGCTPAGPDFGNLMFGLASELVVATTVRDLAFARMEAQEFVTGPFAPPREALTTRDDPADEPPAIGAFPFDDPALGDADRRAAYAGLIDRLERMGFEIHEVAAHEIAEVRRMAAEVFRDMACITVASGVAALHPAPERDDLEPMTLAAARRGAELGAAGAVEAFRRMGQVSRMLEMLFSQIDVLVTPMLTSAPPKLGAFPTDHEDVEEHFAAFDAFAPWAAMCNVGGQPALSLPVGLDRDGLPMAVQLIGPMGGDGDVLELADFLETHCPWPRFAPIAGFDT